MTNSPPVPRLRIRRPEDLLAAVPYLLGFHPIESVVAVGITGGRLTFAARADLPPAGQGPDQLAGYLADVVDRQRLDGAVLIGYGPPDRVDPTLLAARAALPVPVYDLLRVCDGRYWSYTCTEPGCCTPTGTPFDVSTSPVAAAAAYAGVVALPDRSALVARVAPVTGPARHSMREATGRAKRRLSGLTASAVLTAGTTAARDAIARIRAGGTLTDDDVAWLTVLLCDVAVRDRAWAGITASQPHVDLWVDVVRRADPALVAAPASLLAFAAWRSGDGALAAVALERALAADPDYSLALLMDDVLRTGAPPSMLDDWPAPGQAAPGNQAAPAGQAVRAAGRAERRPGRRRSRSI